MEGVDAPTAAWARDMMKRQVQHMVRLVDDLLDVSRIMRGKVQIRKQRLPLKEVIDRGLETAQPLIASQGHELVLDIPAEPIWIEADPVRIAQVIANLLNNAAKFNAKPGHIWVHGPTPRRAGRAAAFATTASASNASCCRGSSTSSPRPTVRSGDRRAAWASA